LNLSEILSRFLINFWIQFLGIFLLFAALFVNLILLHLGVTPACLLVLVFVVDLFDLLFFRAWLNNFIIGIVCIHGRDRRLLDHLHFFPFLLPLLHLLLLSEHGLVHFDLLDVTAVSASSAYNGSRTVLGGIVSFLVELKYFLNNGAPLLSSLDLINLILFAFNNR